MTRGFWFRATVHLLIATLYAQTALAFVPARPRAMEMARLAAPRVEAGQQTVNGSGGSGGSGGNGGGSGSQLSFFGPKRYTRTAGPPNRFTAPVTVPAWAGSPFKLKVVNGEANGSNRITAATIHLNGVCILRPSDFKKATYVIERSVSLPAGATVNLEVELESKPGSYLTISVGGVNRDTRAPNVTIAQPAPGSTITDDTPALSVTYADQTAGGAPASGIDVATFQVLLDGVDRTSWFTTTASTATGVVPPTAALTAGAHTLIATIKDRAGNTGTATATFTVQTSTAQPPTVTITQPADAAVLKDPNVTVAGTFTEHADGPATIQCRIGTVTSPAQISGSGFTCGVTLTEGANRIDVVITDSNGVTGQAFRNVTLDATPPAVSITSPANLSYTADTAITVSGNVTGATSVSVNGVAATIIGEQFEALNVPVAGPTTTLRAVAADAAGNTDDDSVTVTFVSTELTVAITSPADRAVVKGPLVEVKGTVSQDVPITSVDVNNENATLTPGQFIAVVPLLEGEQMIRATARDGAGRTKTAEATVTIDTKAPEITLTEPANGAVTNAPRLIVAGTVIDPHGAKLTVNGQEVAVTDPATSGQFSTELTLADGTHTIELIATDDVGNASEPTRVTVHVDRSAPTLTIASPQPNSVVTGTPVVVQGTVSDVSGSTVGVTVTVDGVAAEVINNGAWHVSFDELPGTQHTFIVIARDAAGNAVEVPLPVRLDSAPPVITITSPTTGTLTRFATIDVTGTVQDLSRVTVKIDEKEVVASEDGTFTLTDVPIREGDVTLVVTATDAGNRSSNATVIITRDSTAPQLELTAPERVTRRQSGQAVATVNDNVGIAQVAFEINGVAAGTVTQSPFALPLIVPGPLALGGTFKVKAIATDRAGNVTSDEVDVRLAADGAIVGQVLSDATGLPLPEATVHIGAGSSSEPRTTDAQGRYTLPTEQASMTLTATKDGMTSVTRVVSMASGTGTVPVDARLTPLAGAVTIGAAGGQLSTVAAGNGGGAVDATATATWDATITVTVPEGAVAGDSPFQLTALSAQGLPELLPLGWSPVAAFDLRGTAAFTGELDVAMTLARPSQTFPASPLPALTLVQHRPVLHTWNVVARDLAVSDVGRVVSKLTSTGAYAFVLADTLDQPLTIPEVGQALAGVNVTDLPGATTTKSVVSPAVIPPTGGIARGELSVQSPLPVPSGTIVQTEITETFTLPSGQVASEEMRRADVVLYRAPNRVVTAEAPATPPAPDAVPALGAIFPITPSRTFEPTALVSGRVHLDILAGRESARGTTGGKEAVTVTADGARLIVPAGGLTEDTAIALERETFSSFLPTHGALTPLAEVTVDLAGRNLTQAAELSIDANGATTGKFVIAQVERVDGVPYLTVVARAELQGGRIVPSVVPGLPGVTRGGRYVFYRVEGSIGLVTGVTRAGTQPALAIVSTDLAPFVARSGVDGRYTVVTLEGSAIVTARVPRTSLQTQRAATVDADETTPDIDLTLAASATTATISPTNGTARLPRSTQVQITTTTPIDPESVSTATILLRLEPGTGDPVNVPVRVVLAASRQLLSIVPVTALTAGATYHAQVADLRDAFGGLISTTETRFQTADDAAPNYTADSLSFSFPNAQGFVTISAPEASFPAGTEFLIINSTSGEVITFNALNDGAVSTTLRASIHDRLVITITDPDGRVTTLTRSQYVDAETGRTAIGSGGGVVKGPGGLELRVPESAVARAVTLQLTPLAESAFDPKPALEDAQFGGGVTLTSAEMPSFQREVDLAFPVPANLEAEVARQQAQLTDAFFYVFRKLSGPDGKVFYETIDIARLEGTGANLRIVTASCPFSGVTNVWGSFGQGVVNAAIETHYLLLWTLETTRPARPTTGIITGVVQRPVWEPGATSPRFVGVPGVPVWGVDGSGVPLENQDGGAIAVTQADGRYTLFDKRFVPGNFILHTQVDGRAYEQPVYPLTTEAVADPCVTGMRTLFDDIGIANITVAPAEPPPPAPSITIRLFKTENNQRVDTRGLAIANTPLLIGATASGDSVTITSVVVRRIGDLQGESLVIHDDPARQTTPPDPLAMQVITSDTWTPTRAGAYEIAATALPLTGGTVTSTIAIRIIADGGGVTTDQDNAPAVITAQTVPTANATGVPVTIFPEIAFTEPVRNVFSRVKMLDAAGAPVPVRISGVGVNAQGEPVAIPDVNSDTIVVTAITLQPETGLKFGTQYRLAIEAGVVDLDTPAAKALAPFESTFTTFAPEELGGTEQTFASPGFVVLGDRSYVLETNATGGVGGGQVGWLRTFDITDPVLPSEIPPAQYLPIPPRDIGGDLSTVAVVTMPLTQFVPGPGTSTVIQSGPSNLLVYDASGATPTWVGVASLTDNLLDGVPSRVVVKDSQAFVATTRKGVQIVDLSMTAFGEFGTLPEYQQFAKLYQPGSAGVNREAVATIALRDPKVPQALTYPTDLKVGDFTVDDEPGRRLALVTGRPAAIGLVIIDAERFETMWQVEDALSLNGVTLSEGTAVALGHVGDQQLALVGGYGVSGAGSTGLVAVVDLSPLAASPRGEPTVLAFVSLSHTVADIVITDQTAIVSSTTGAATLINLGDPSQPKIAGSLTGVGSRLGLNTNVVFSTNRTYIRDSSNPLGGLRTSTLKRVAVIRRVTPIVPRLTSNPVVTAQPVVIDAALVPTSERAETAVVRIYKNGAVAATLPAERTGAVVRATWPAGVEIDVRATYAAEAVFDEGMPSQTRSSRRRIPMFLLDVDADTDNNNGNENPSGSDEEDAVEDIEGNVQRPGKVVFVNNGDVDGNGIPDYADGYDRFGPARANASGRLTPVMLKAPEGIDLRQLAFRFEYAASDPAAVTRIVSASGEEEYVAPPGGLRLWTKQGAAARKAGGVLDGGDYVPPGVEIPATALGTPASGRTWVLFAEALTISAAPADQRIQVSLIHRPPDGAALETADAVRLTALETRWVQPDSQNGVRPVKSLELSHPSPVVTLTTATVTNLRLDAAQRVVGDLTVSGTVTCAVCDYTPGAAGRIDNVTITVNEAPEPLAAIPVAGTKAENAPSLLRPYAFNGTFQQTLEAVRLSEGSNTLRLTATDGVYQFSGFAEATVPIRYVAPAPIALDYRVNVDFGSARQLTDLTPETPVHLTVVERAGATVRTYTGDVFRTADDPLTFSNQDAVLVIGDAAELEAALAPTLRGSIEGRVQVSAFAPVGLSYLLRESADGSNVFGREVTAVQVTVSAPPQPDVIDQLQVTVSNATGDQVSATLVETSAASQQFISADGATRVTVPVAQPRGGWSEGITDALVSSESLGIADGAVTLVADDVDATRWATNERTVIEPDDLPTSADQYDVRPTEPGVKSNGGIFHPYLLELRGPTALLDQITSIEIGGQSHLVRRAFDGRYYVVGAPQSGTMTAMAAADDGPRVVLIMPGTPNSLVSPLESADFFLGYALGFGGGAVDVVVGAVKLVGLLVVEGIRLSPAGFAYVTTFGDKYESETRFVKGATNLAMTTAKIVAELQADRDELMFDLLTLQWSEAAMVSEPYRVALGYGAELISALWEEYLALPRREQGRLLGRAVFELASVAVAYAKVGALEKLTKLEFLEALRARPFFQQPAVARALNKLEGLVSALRTTQMCFVAGTKVLTREGLRNIEDLRVGDWVLSRDADTGEQAYRAVVDTIVTHPERLYHVRYRHDGGGEDELVATGEHPFYVLERDAFVAARDLVAGETLSLADGATATIVGVTTEDPRPGQILTTYNVEVDEFHTYFVGESGVWVHNAAGRNCQNLRSLVERLKQQGKTPNEILETVARLRPHATDEAMARLIDELLFTDVFPGIDDLFTTGKYTGELKHLLAPPHNLPPALVERMERAGNLWQHYKKHVIDGGEFPDIKDVVTYLQRAREHSLNPPSGSLTGLRIGDDGQWEFGVMTLVGPRKGEFSVAVLNPDNTHTLKSFFVRAKDPEQYFRSNFAKALIDPVP